MTDHEGEEEQGTSESAGGVGPEKTHEATTPPGQGDLDEEAVEDARERLDQAGH